MTTNIPIIIVAAVTIVALLFMPIIDFYGELTTFDLLDIGDTAGGLCLVALFTAIGTLVFGITRIKVGALVCSIITTTILGLTTMAISANIDPECIGYGIIIALLCGIASLVLSAMYSRPGGNGGGYTTTHSDSLL